MHVAIHGHFYQPPRENPWTGEVPRQESAAPFHDWNARITDECYGPNGRSRILDPQGRITAIVNNFAHLSFDFGPTLLKDLEDRFPEVYHKILEADRESTLRRGGHGNALAHAFNHMILPLANLQDKRTQVRWGLRDFEHRFARQGEGFWLPETACDAETLSVVAESGIRFLLLAPHQALRWRKRGDREWREVTFDNPIDTSLAYRCVVNGAGNTRRTIDVYFYDPGLSVAVSFEHLLRNSDAFARRLAEAGAALGPWSEPPSGRPASDGAPSSPAGDGRLVHVATDGEIYGHHEPFGDMCLSYLFHHEGQARGLHFVNYAEMLERYPAEHEVQLNFADTGEGTAWSCAHGVGRWIRDCGCSTGGRDGWNQRWRTPLRRGLDAIRDSIQSAYLIQTSPYLRDPWVARDGYIDILLHPGEETRESFLRRHLVREADGPARQRIWSLLEATHQAMLMYTSCAWFFADISGLEVQQNLGYAARACELAQPWVAEPLEPLLLRHLEQAQSNIPAFRDGAAVYRELVMPRRIGPEHAGAQAIFEAVELDRPLERSIYRYEVRGELDRGWGHATESTGRIRVSDPQVEQSWSWSFRVSEGAWDQREVSLEPAVDPDASVAPFSAALLLRDLPQEVREEIARSALGQALEEEAKRIAEIYEDAKVPMQLLCDLGLAIPDVHRHIGSYVLGSRLRQLASGVHLGPQPLPDSWWEAAEQHLNEAGALKLRVDPGPLPVVLSGRITHLLDAALAERDNRTALSLVTSAYETLARADRLSLPLPRTGLEPRAYDLVLRFRRELSEPSPEGGSPFEAQPPEMTAPLEKSVPTETTASTEKSVPSEKSVATEPAALIGTSQSGTSQSGMSQAGMSQSAASVMGARALRSLAAHANLQVETILKENSPEESAPGRSAERHSVRAARNGRYES